MTAGLFAQAKAYAAVKVAAFLAASATQKFNMALKASVIGAVIGADSLIRQNADRKNAISNGHISINRKIIAVLLVFPRPRRRRTLA